MRKRRSRTLIYACCLLGSTTTDSLRGIGAGVWYLARSNLAETQAGVPAGFPSLDLVPQAGYRFLPEQTSPNASLLVPWYSKQMVLLATVTSKTTETYLRRRSSTRHHVDVEGVDLLDYLG